MQQHTEPYFWRNNDLHLELQIQTKAAKNAIVGEYGNRLKVTINAVPEDGKANLQLIKFLAKYFAVKSTQVKILNGLQSKYKSVVVIEPQNNLDSYRYRSRIMKSNSKFKT